MRFGSVCSGIEAASVAWHPLGWKAAWLSEIEPFPSAVLKYHYPDVPNLGDMTLLPDRIASGEVEAPDLFCGGTPCQAFSVAGLRKSLDDARGNLSLVFCEIANAIDKRRQDAGLVPGIIFWENVPGVLSTKDNAFGCFIAGLAGETDPVEPPRGKWPNAGVVLGPQRTVAWRVLDAQYFGVAQRRRRVFVVASARDDFDPASVLLEFEGVRRDFAPSRKAREVAPTIPSRSTAGGGLGTDFDLDGEVIQQPSGKQWPAEIASTLDTSMKKYMGYDNQHVNSGCPWFVPADPIAIQGNLIGRDLGGPRGVGASEDGVMYTLTKADQHAVSYGIRTANTSSNGWGIQEEVTHTLDTAQGVAVAQPIAFENSRRDGVRLYDSVSNTLQAFAGTGGGNGPMVAQPIAFPSTMSGTQHASAEDIAPSMGAKNPTAIAYSFDSLASNSMKSSNPYSGCRETDLAKTIDTTDPNPSKNQGGIAVMQAVAVDIDNTNLTGQLAGNLCAEAQSRSNKGIGVMQYMAVRRLTPVECERLQGFPDGYTNIPWRKAPEAPDGPRYKALGNSWAVPVVRWIGSRIARAVSF